jgi:CD109 antigen
MKALIEYTIRTRIREVSGITVTVEATALPGHKRILHVTNENLAVLQNIEVCFVIASSKMFTIFSLQIPQAWGTVKVQANGAGYAILQMSVQYNVDIARFQTQPPVKSFHLQSTAHYFGRNQSHITYQSCQRFDFLISF